MSELVLLALLAGVGPPVGPEPALPAGATVRLGTLRFRHAGGQAVAFSPDGRLLATGDGRGAISLCEVPSGRLRRRLTGHNRVVHDLVFTPDGKRLISAADDWTIRTWDVATGQEVGVFYPGHEERVVWRLAVSPDGKLLASSGEAGKVTLRDLPGGKVRARLPGNRFYGHCLHFSPDGKTLAASGANREGISLFDADLSGPNFGKPLRLLKGPAGSFAFTPDGQALWALGDERQLRLWGVGGQVKKAVNDVIDHRVESVACFAGGKRLACVGQGRGDEAWRVLVLDAATGKRLHTFRWHAWDSRPPRLAVSPDGRALAVVGLSPAARLWDGVTGQELERTPGHHYPPTSLAFTADGKTLVSAGADGAVRVWDAVTGRERRHIDAGPASTRAQTVAVAPDGRTLATGGDGPEVRLWAAATGKRLRALEAHPDPGPFRDGRCFVQSVAFAPDGKRLVSVGRNGDARVWDVATGKSLKGLTDRGSSAGEALFVGPRKVALLGARPGLHRSWRPGRCAYKDDVPAYDIETGLATGLKARESSGVSLSADGARAAGVVEQGAEVWDTQTGKRLCEVKAPALAVLLSPDGKVLAAVTAGDELGLWDASSGKRLAVWNGCRAAVAMAFRPDGRAVATAHGDSSILLWEVPRR